MITEVNKAKQYFKDKFVDSMPEPGTYAIPIETSRGNAFMKVILDEKLFLGDFSLWQNEALTQPW